jgi:hypothetical protein
MAKIKEEILLVKVSKIVKNGDAASPDVLSDEIALTVEQVVAELLGDAVVVEVERLEQ